MSFENVLNVLTIMLNMSRLANESLPKCWDVSHSELVEFGGCPMGL